MRSARCAAVGILVCLACACRPREAVRATGHPTAAAPAVAPAAPAARMAQVPVEGGVLRRRLVAEPTTLNAVLQSSAAEAEVLQYVQRNLLDFDAQMRLVPGLAEHWEASANGLDYTLTLRADAVWEDGRAITASDVAFTIGKIADPKVPSNVYRPLFDELDSVKVLDERTLRVRFKTPYAFRAMAFVIPVLPERSFAGQNFLRARENRAPVASGPYRVASWATQQAISLERNPRYPGTPGHFDRILFRILPDDTTAYRLLTAGELDEDQLSPAVRDRALRDVEFQGCCRIVEFYNLDYNYVALNNRSPFFADARVRRALTMLVDRASIVRGLYKGSARIISGPWAPDSPAYDPGLAALPFDPPAAAKLLSEAGWRDTNGNGTLDKDGKEFEFDLLVSEGSEVGRQIDEMLASELAKVGVTARIRMQEWGSFVERVDSGNFAAASLAWSAVDPNPDPYFYWHSSQCAPNGLNDGCYRNPEADRLMEEARREADSGKRNAIYHRLHRIFRDDAPAIFVVNASQKYAFRSDVRGVETSPLSFFFWPGPLGWGATASSASPGGAGAATPVLLTPTPTGASTKPAA
jgi:peptide/nickel transport system substrate-binding protein